MNITNAILHILDNQHRAPILSVKELEIESEIREFFEKHIVKVLGEGSVKQAYLEKENNEVFELFKQVAEGKSPFVEISQKLADILFKIMKQNPAIPPADLALVIFEDEQGKHMAIMKLNYKSSYIHFVIDTEEGNLNKLVKQKTTLPSENQKVDECIIVNLSNFELKVLEKKYEICGEKDNYLTKHFLKCKSELSSLEKIKILEKVSSKVSKKHFDKDFETVTTLKTCMAESIEDSGEVRLNHVAQVVFGQSEPIKQEYLAEVKKAGLAEEVVEIPPETTTSKKFKTQKVRTDSGIEINFPSHMYHDKDLIEFINNPDGTISILIKNINKVTNRR